jgi:hypothetical protein
MEAFFYFTLCVNQTRHFKYNLSRGSRKAPSDSCSSSRTARAAVRGGMPMEKSVMGRRFNPDNMGIVCKTCGGFDFLDTYTIKSENSSLTLSQMFPKNLPSLRWEGMKERGDQTVSISSTPTRTLPHRRGRGLSRKSQIFLVRI